MTRRLLTVSLLVVLIASWGHADFVRASRSATVRAEPSSTAAIVGRVDKDDELPLLADDKTNGWYKVQRPDGTGHGWIFRTMVRRHTGSLPGGTPGDAAGDGETPTTPTAQPRTAAQQKLIDEHAKFGLPSTKDLFIRTAYVMGYDRARRIPSWVCYHVTKDYRKTPERKSRFKSFRSDPDIDNEGSDAEYTGSGLARGHLTPYGVLGGDRDLDGKLAMLLGESDLDDEKTIFEGNFMSNVTPQHHNGFNGAGAVWFTLERWIQDKLVGPAGDVWVMAGAVFNGRTTETIGPTNDIHVPPIFYKVVAIKQQGTTTPLVLAFLFPHHRDSRKGIENYLVTVDTIEAATGLDLFPDLADTVENTIEAEGTWKRWKTFTDLAGTP